MDSWATFRQERGSTLARGAPKRAIARLDEAQQLAHMGSWELDIGSGKLYWSDEVYRIFELDPSRFVPSYEHFLALIHPEDSTSVKAAFEASLASGEPYAIDHRLLMPDGRVKHVHERGVTHYDAQQRPLRSVGTVQDITQRHRIEQELREKSAALAERLKEMHCLSQTIELLSDDTLDLPELLNRVLELIPPAMRWPELCGATLWLNDQQYGSPAFNPDAPCIHQDIQIDGKQAGRLSVSCNPPRAILPEQTFLPEEVQLIKLLGLKIGQFIERRRDQDSFRMLIENAPDAMVIVDRTGVIQLINAQTERLFGYARGELIGQPVETLVPDQLTALHRQHRQSYNKDPRARAMGNGLDLKARRKDGSEFPVEISLSTLHSPLGMLISSTIRDVSERRQAEITVQRLLRMRTMMSDINAVIVRASTREELLDEACRIAVRRGGFRLAWVGLVDDTGKIELAAWHGGDEALVRHIVDQTNAGRQRQPQGPNNQALRRHRGFAVNDIAASDSIAPWRDAALAADIRSMAALPLMLSDKVAGLISLYAGEVGFFDADELALLNEMAADVSFSMAAIEHRERLDYLAYYDPLTQLANRRLFSERLGSFAQSTPPGRMMALLLLDIERFKAVNDALGSNAGDRLLQILAERLRERAGGSEFVARIGGDQFAIIVPNVRVAAELSRFLRDELWTTLTEPLQLAGEQLHPSARIGIALLPNDGHSPDELFRNAEAALKQAKQSGERFVFYAQDMNRSVHQNLRLQNQLRQAMQNQQLALHYQPKIDLARGHICGAEALLRWPDGEAQGVSCSDTIRMLEASGDILQIGRWALIQAMQDRQRWRDMGLKAPPVAVNVSVLQLQQADFDTTITQLLSQFDHGDCGLELELTESTLMHDVSAHLEKLQHISDLGVPIAIDDFGTGYSSLSYLSRLPVHALKIDHSFIAGMTNSPDDMSIVSAIISLAHSMNLKVVAEGVETEEQLKFLRLLRCDEMQGFLISHALSAEDFASFLHQRSATQAGPGRPGHAPIPKLSQPD